MSRYSNAVSSDSSLGRPVMPGERILALDVLRGFGLFGVLLAYLIWNLGTPPGETFGRFDTLLGLFFECFVDSKFYTILSFLFGLGFSLQLGRATEKGASVVAVYCRRLLVLLLIGLLHALLLRNGDILVPYAVAGFLLLPFRHASNRTILTVAFLMIFYSALARAVWQLTGVPIPSRPQTDGMGLLASNFEWVKYWYSTGILRWFGNLSVFLFGFYAGRNKLLEKIANRRRTMWQIIIVGLAVGITLFFIRESFIRSLSGRSTNSVQRLTVGLLFAFHAWAVAASYMSLLLLLLQKKVWQSWLTPLAAVGRMALTNYLMQAAIIIPICLVFELFDKFTPSFALLLALAVFFLLQVPFSLIWLKYFNFGPVEWVWRSLTYGNLHSIREPAVVKLS